MTDKEFYGEYDMNKFMPPKLILTDINWHGRPGSEIYYQQQVNDHYAKEIAPLFERASEITYHFTDKPYAEHGLFTPMPVVEESAEDYLRKLIDHLDSPITANSNTEVQMIVQQRMADVYKAKAYLERKGKLK